MLKYPLTSTNIIITKASCNHINEGIITGDITFGRYNQILRL